jgi:hypothetical protein
MPEREHFVRTGWASNEHGEKNPEVNIRFLEQGKE